MDLKESARQWVLAHLPHDRGNVDLAGHLASLDASDLLTRYFNWSSRLLQPPRPRRLLKSRAFEANPIVSNRADDLTRVIDDIECGRELTKYMSRDVLHAVQHPNQKGRRRDLDLMINDWGVHHLHISAQVEADGFVKRDGPLLFAAFMQDCAYLIDIMKHGDWTRHHVLEVLVDEWPDAGLIYEMRGALGLSKPVSEKDRKVLRSKHTNSAFEYRGKVYMPRGFMTSAGTTIHARKGADQAVDRIEVFERQWQAHDIQIRAECAAQGVQLPSEPSFEFIIREDGYGIIETQTRAWFKLS